jgi:Mrp family chromosome partitioning ATPase
MTYGAPLPHQGTPMQRGAAVTRRLWRRRRVFTSVFLLLLLSGATATFLLSPVFYAFGTVVIGDQESSSTSAAWAQRLGDPADLESQLLIARSRRMLRLALARPGMTETAIRDCYASMKPRILIRQRVDCSKLEPDGQELVEYVEGRYTVKAVGRSRVIAMGYESALPDAASIMANGLLITYLEDQRAENARSRETTAAWLLKESRRLEGELGVADAAMVKNAQGLLSPEGAEQRKRFYLDLHKKVSDLESERRMLVSSGRLVSLAEVPRSPFFPKPARMLAATLALSALLAGLAALRRDSTDATARSVTEVENATLVPVLAALPHFKQRRRSLLGQPHVRAAAPSGATSDTAIGKLLGRLMMSGEGRFLLTSTTGDEGKSSVALALAGVAAKRGMKALVVDAHFAHAPKIGVGTRRGFTDILHGDCKLEDVVVPARAGFDIVPPGTIASNYASGQFAQHALVDLMHSSANYDLVLIDGPPWDTGAEAARLAQCVEGVLWCAQWGKTILGELAVAMTEYREWAGGAHVLGILLTSVEPGELQWFETSTRPGWSRALKKRDADAGGNLRSPASAQAERQ